MEDPDERTGSRYVQNGRLPSDDCHRGESMIRTVWLGQTKQRWLMLSQEHSRKQPGAKIMWKSRPSANNLFISWANGCHCYMQHGVASLTTMMERTIQLVGVACRWSNDVRDEVDSLPRSAPCATSTPAVQGALTSVNAANAQLCIL